MTDPHCNPSCTGEHQTTKLPAYIDPRGAYECGLVEGEECIAKLRAFVEEHESERWTNPAVAMAEEIANVLDATVVQGLTRLYGAWLKATSPVTPEFPITRGRTEPRLPDQKFGLSENLIICPEPKAEDR